MPPKKKRTKTAPSADDGDAAMFPVAEGSDGYSSDSASSFDSTMVTSYSTTEKYMHDGHVTSFLLLLRTVAFVQEVQVDFEARMIDDSDFHGMRRLLQQVSDFVTFQS